MEEDKFELKQLDSSEGEVLAMFVADFSDDIGDFHAGDDVWLWFLKSPENGALWCFGVSDEFDEDLPETLFDDHMNLEWLRKIAAYAGTHRENFGCPHCHALDHYEVAQKMSSVNHEHIMNSTIEELVEYRKRGEFRAWESMTTVPQGIPHQSMN